MFCLSTQAPGTKRGPMLISSSIRLETRLREKERFVFRRGIIRTIDRENPSEIENLAISRT